MKRMIKYNKIGDFKKVIRSIKDEARYRGVVKLPTIEFNATEKIHGTNAAVCYSIIDGFWVQSRERILTLESDNLGCAFAAYKNEEEWIEIIIRLARYNNIDLSSNIISIYYEWAGGSIQKKSALTGLDKRAIIFAHAKVSPLLPDPTIVESENQPAYWIDTVENGNFVMNHEANIYNILAYDTWQISIDFNEPERSVNSFLKLLHENELNSPVGKYMGIEKNVLEGMVWTGRGSDDELLKFKVKGEKHTSSKVRTLKPVDDVKEQAKNDLIDLVVTPSRLEQGWQLLFGANNEIKLPEKKDISDFLRWVINDIMSEHVDDYFEAGIEPKELNGKISQVARIWYFEQYEKSE